MADRHREKPLEEGDKTRDHSNTPMHRLSDRSPRDRQVVGLLKLFALGATGLFVGGLTVGGTILTLLALTPVLLFLSPVLVPLFTIAAFVIGGVLIAAGAVIAAISGLSWLYNYAKGRHPPGSEQVEAARNRLQETTVYMKARAREYLQNKTEEVAPGA